MPTDHIAEKQEKQSIWEFILIVFLYASFITAIFTFPLILVWRTHIPGLAFSDGIEHAWFAWWYQRAIFYLGQSPAQLTSIFYPYEYYHPLITVTPWSRLLPSLAVYFGASLPETYNVHIFLSYILTWVFMSLLCLEITGNHEAAIIGGAIFALFPNRNVHVLSGHLTQLLTYAYPLLVLTLWRVWKQPTLKRGIWCGIAFILVATIDLMPLAYFAVPMTSAILLFYLLTDRKQLFSAPMLKSLGIGFLIAALVLIPLFLPLLLQFLEGGLGWYKEAGIEQFSADLVSIFVPPPGHFLARTWPPLQSLSQNVYYFGASYFEAIIYMGWVTLMLAALGVIKMRKEHPDITLWLLIAVGALILALGPILRVGGKVITLGDGQMITLPYYWISKLPFLSWGRTPARLNYMVMFATAILASYGLTWLFARVRVPIWRVLLMGALLLLIFLDSKTQFPWPMLDATIPDFYHQIATAKGDGAIFDLPSDDYMADKYAMLYQTVHLRPITAGRAYRIPPEVVEFRKELTEAVTNGETELLRENNIAYVVLHRNFLTSSELETLRRQLISRLGEPLYEDERIIAFATGYAR